MKIYPSRPRLPCSPCYTIEHGPLSADRGLPQSFGPDLVDEAETGAAFVLLSVAAGFPGCVELRILRQSKAARAPSPPRSSPASIRPPSCPLPPPSPSSGPRSPITHTNYNVYIKHPGRPHREGSVFNTFAVTGLSSPAPPTPSPVSQSTSSNGGAQDGIGKQIDAQTWTPFLGRHTHAPPSRTRPTSNLVWK